MNSFFYGWRRKAGCINLMMALLVAGAWCRSFYQVDTMTTELGTTRIALASTEGRVVLDQRKNNLLGRSGTAKLSATIRIELSDKIDKMRFRYLSDWSIDWRRKWLGFEFGEARQMSGTHVTFRIIPYWSIVCVVALVSALLILYKPRRSQQSMTTTVAEQL